jgi:hypothetical protein
MLPAGLWFFLASATSAWYLSIAVAQVCSAAYSCSHWLTAERMLATVRWTWARLPDAYALVTVCRSFVGNWASVIEVT